MNRELWLCLRLQAPALAAVQRRLQTVPEHLAVLDGPAQRPQVWACSQAAAARGVRPGQSVPAARALCPALVTLPRDPEAEQALHALLGAWAYGYSDRVSLALPESVALEVGGSLRLFRGWPALERRLRADLDGLGLSARLALAPRARAAWVLASSAAAADPSPVGAGRTSLMPNPPESPSGAVRDDAIVAVARDDATRRSLDALPISAAGLPDSAIAALRAMGFLRLRELASIDRASLGRRIGSAALQQLDRLYGRSPDPLPLWQPPPSFEAVIEFDARPTAVEPLLFALRRLLADLAAVLQARDGGVQRFRLLLLHEDHPVTSVPIGLLRPERDPARLLDLSRARLERAELPAPIAGVALIADELPPFRPATADLFAPGRQDSSDWPLLLERLRARLGDSAVQRPVLRAEHRPERASALIPVTGPERSAPTRRSQTGSAGPTSAASAPTNATGAGALQAGERPIWLLPRPIPLRPAPARILAGPERLESGWWDGGDVRRDYYIVETVQGQRAWVYTPPGQPEGWMLHGWFA